MRVFPLFATLAASVLLAACASTAKTSNPDDPRATLTGQGAWRITDVRYPKGQPVAAFANTNYRLQFVDQKLTIYGGCNQMFGNYSIKGRDGLLIEPLASTRMACEEPKMRNDAWLSKQLETPIKLRFKDDMHLEMELLDGSKMQLEAIPLE